ncbi:MAG TPA: substrate-binding domain-containing protein [Edaphocola sp.]|nr:substrate-binding domain-containing protein [Edaphocola sp.]
MKKTFFLLSMLAGISFFYACGNGPGSGQPKETTSSGHIRIAIDESLRPVMAQQLAVFDSSFPKADIKESYKSETDCFRDFFNDSARMIIVSRDLTKEERKLLTQNGARVRSMPVAMGAIALVVNPASPDSLMTLGQVKSILTNTFIRKYNIVFDNERSGTVRYLVDSLIPGQKLPSNVYALNGNDSVLNYVAAHPNAIGVLGALNIYSNVDTGAGTFRPGVKVVALKNDSTNDFYQPYQAYIALRLYPMLRPVYFISHDSWQGLATGFANFLSGQRGQLIFKHAWMAPLCVPLNVREVNIKP